MHRFYRGLFGIAKLYLILVLFLLILYFFLSKIEPLILNLIFMIILIVGIFIDKRFNWKSKIIIIVISIIQLFLYYYLELIPILLVKDLFWYSVLLNMCFMWHVVILHWCFELCERNRLDVGCYIFSRLSVVTSLTGIYWLLNSIIFFINWINDYYYWISKMKKTPLKLSKIDRLIDKFQGWNYAIDCVISIIKAIILYFMFIFKSYSLLLLGKHNNPFWKQSIWFYVRFLVLFTVSIYLMIPRIYIIWAISLMLKSIDVLYNIIQVRISSENWRFSFWFIAIEHEIIGNYRTEPGFDANWEELYNKEYYLDYVIFCNKLDWFFSDNDYERSPYNLYDIFEVFIYNKDRRIIIISNYYCLGAPDSPSECVTKYNLQITEKDFIKIVENIKKLPLIKMTSSTDRITLWDYIKLEKGHYF